jgi:hypothetical protein
MVMAPAGRNPEEAKSHLTLALKVFKHEDPLAPEGALISKANALKESLRM